MSQNGILYFFKFLLRPICPYLIEVRLIREKSRGYILRLKTKQGGNSTEMCTAPKNWRGGGGKTGGSLKIAADAITAVSHF